MKIFKEFLKECEELTERRKVQNSVVLGRIGNKMTRQERTAAAIAKKAGFRGTAKFSTKDLRSKPTDYTTYDSKDVLDDVGSTAQDHYIRSYASPRRAARGEQLIKKFKPAGKTSRGGMTTTKLKIAPSSESVRRLRSLRKQMIRVGANKRGAVHNVDVMHRDSDVGKGDKTHQIERGKNFIQAIKDTPKHLERAGAKKGDTVMGKPTAVMPDEDKNIGVKKRAKLYKKIFGKRSTKPSKSTGIMVGKV